MEEVKPSQFNDDLIKNPNGKRKFTSAMIHLDMMTKMTVRQTYGVLDYLGDIGGLVDFFYYLGTFVLIPVWKFIYSNQLLTKAFRVGTDRSTSEAPLDPISSLK